MTYVFIEPEISLWGHDPDAPHLLYIHATGSNIKCVPTVNSKHNISFKCISKICLH